MPDTLVSVVIPTYNRAYIVGDAIRSVLAQSYPNIEIVVVNDGSTDDTPNVLKSFGGKLRIVDQSNAGPAAARNRGIRSSKGSILAFLDSDDLWAPTYIERQVSILEKAGLSIPCSLCNGWLEFTEESKSTAFDFAEINPNLETGLWLNPDEIFVTRFLQFNQMAAIRRTAIEKVGLFDPQLKYLEDWDLALRLSLYKPWCFIKEPLVAWRQQRDDSLSRIALSEQGLVRSTVVDVLQQAMQLFQQSNCSPQLNRYMVRELVRNKRKRRIAILAERGDLGLLWGKVLKKLYKIRELHWRYPNMQVSAIERN